MMQGTPREFFRVAWAAKEFIDDWKKGDFSLSPLAALDAQSLDAALVALSEAHEAALVDPTSAGDGEIVKARVLDDKDLHGWDHQRHDFMREHAETFTNELGREIRIVGWRSASDPLAIRYILEGPHSHTYQTMTPREAERLIQHLQAALVAIPPSPAVHPDQTSSMTVGPEMFFEPKPVALDRLRPQPFGSGTGYETPS